MKTLFQLVQLFYNQLSSPLLSDSPSVLFVVMLCQTPSFYDQIQNITDANVPAWRQHNIAWHRELVVVDGRGE